MGTNRQSTFAQRIAGKWQVPLLGVSTAAFASTLVWMTPAPVPVPVEQRIAELQELKTGSRLREAEAAVRQLLESEEYTPEQLGPVWAELADVIFRDQAARDQRDRRRLMTVLTSFEHAELAGHALPGDALASRGRVYEWLQQPGSAVEQYRAALLGGPSDPLDIRRRILLLGLGPLQAPRPELHADLDQLLADSSMRPDLLGWALEQKVQLLLEEDRLDQARALTAEQIVHLQGSPYAPLGEYLVAWLDYQAGEVIEAELRLRDLRSRRPVRDDLDARTGWLLGRVLLLDDGAQRPLAALSFFEDVIRAHVSGEYVTASKLGKAEALSDLQRFAESLDAYREVLQDLERSGPTRLLNRKAVSSSLAVRSRLQREAGLAESAAEFLELAAALVDPQDGPARALHLEQLALLRRTLGERKSEDATAAAQAGDLTAAAELQKASQDFRLAAADDYLALAALRRADHDNTAAEALWEAARCLDSAGARRRTIELLEQFMAEGPPSSYIPLALYRIGQAYQAEGELPAAIERYRRCIAEFTRTEPAQQSIIPLADCYLMLGNEYTGLAEQTLLGVLDQAPDQPAMFTPQSNVYRDALFKLGDLYSRTGRYEDAIGRLDEALQRYPDDPRRVRATFLLADAYRHSGLQLEEAAAEMSNVLRRDETLAKKRERLRQAEALFGNVVDLLNAGPPSLTTMQELQLQLSYIYRADCAFDLQDFEKALRGYQEVARVYPEEPLALSAYMQIISCLESLGRIGEITPALRRASWLTDKIPAERFADRLTRQSPDDWRMLFAWLKESGGYQ